MTAAMLEQWDHDTIPGSSFGVTQGDVFENDLSTSNHDDVSLVTIPTDDAVVIDDCDSADQYFGLFCDPDAIVGFGFRASMVAGFVRDDPEEPIVAADSVAVTRCTGGSWGYSSYEAGDSGTIALTNEPGSERADVDIDVDGLSGSFEALYCPLGQ